MNNKRFAAFFIDFMITSVICNGPFFLFVIRNISKTAESPLKTILLSILSSFIALLYMVFRDLPEKGSIGKRILELEIIDSRTRQSATRIQRLVRNIFWLAGFVEIVVYFFKQERLGDIVAHTTIVEKKYE